MPKVSSAHLGGGESVVEEESGDEYQLRPLITGNCYVESSELAHRQAWFAPSQAHLDLSPLLPQKPVIRINGC